MIEAGKAEAVLVGFTRFVPTSEVLRLQGIAGVRARTASNLGLRASAISGQVPDLDNRSN
jgi:hypothetical protein